MTNTCRTMQPVAIALVAIASCLPTSRAAIIIDDFTDPAETVSPEMMNEQVYTESVGDLDALRRIRIFGSRVTSVGSMTIGDSSLQAELSNLEAIGPSAISSIQALYRFTELLGEGHEDLTEGGRNNAVILQFSELVSTRTPDHLRITVFDGNTTGDATIPVQLNSEPSRIVVPFDYILPRGQTPIDLTQVVDIAWSFRFGHANEFPADVQFSMAFDRFSVGRVPEPSTQLLLVVAACGMTAMRYVRSRLKEKGRRDDRSKSMGRIAGQSVGGREWASN